MADKTEEDDSLVWQHSGFGCIIKMVFCSIETIIVKAEVRCIWCSIMQVMK